MKSLRWLLVFLLAAAGTLYTSGLARADVSNATATNIQSGSNTNNSSQSGKGKTGSAVGGQVSGVVSSGRASVDAKNTSTNSDVTSGDVHGTNHSASFTGLNSPILGDTTISDVTNSCNDSSFVACNNLQDGNNRSTLNQTVSATSGDGVAGQVIGVVTAGGSASVVAANTSTDSSVETGSADATNNAAAFVGENFSAFGDLSVSDISGSCTDSFIGCENAQDGNNRYTSNQSAKSASGDGIAGQVIGVVSAGRASVDATNRSDGVDVTTGDSHATNDQAFVVGLNSVPFDEGTFVSDVSNSCHDAFIGCANVQSGDNTATSRQSATSTTGDGVGGEVIGVVTSAGGSASVVAANTTTNSDVESGDANATNDLAAFVGLNRTVGGDLTLSDITNSCFDTNSTGCDNLQDGSNRLSGSQTASAASGDGVAGQVLGVVSAGAASVDATNHTSDSSANTGNARSDNHADYFVGLNTASDGNTTIADVSDSCGGGCTNLQDGSNRHTFTQSSDATSGDAVAGQVSGVVTSAGGSASVVLANTSSGIDGTTGDSNFSNDDAGFVGLNTSENLSVGLLPLLN